MNRQFMAMVPLVFLGWTWQCVHAQENSCSQYKIPIVIRDLRGGLVHGFSASDLEAMVNGTPLNISGVGRESRQRRIVILLDASGSMEGIGKEEPWWQAIASARLLSSLSEGRARLALLIFNEKVIEEVGFGSDNSAITKRLDALKKDREFFVHSVDRRTALFDSMNRALELLEQPTSADELYVASDGADNHSRLTRKDLQRRIAECGVRVFVTLLQPPLANRNRTPEDLHAGPESAELAERTGGGIMYINPAEVALGFQTRPNLRLLEGVRMFFDGMFANEVLHASLTSENLKKRDLRITLSPSAKDHMKGAQLFYPRQLYACAPAQSATSAH